MPRPHIADYSPQLFILFPPFSRKNYVSAQHMRRSKGGGGTIEQLFAFCCRQPPLSGASLCSEAKERDYMEIIFTRMIARRGHTMLNYLHNLHF
jgi:hypothetical protein